MACFFLVKHATINESKEHVHMTYKGHIENGAVIFDEPVTLPEGAILWIDVEMAETPPAGHGTGSLAERLASVIGIIDGLPEDAAINHDHYLYGAPKK